MGAYALSASLDDARGKLYTEAVCRARRGEKEFYLHASGCGEDAVFDLASVSKIVTGTFILELAGKGRLALDDTLDRYFGAEAAGPATAGRFKTISVRSLLSHRSGLPAWYPFYVSGRGFWESLEDLLKNTAPMEGTLYSDINFMLLGELSVKLSGRSLKEQLEGLNGNIGAAFSYGPVAAETCVPTEYGNRVEMGMCAERGLSFDGWRSTEARIRAEANDGNCYYFWNGVAGHAGIFGNAGDLLALAGLYLDRGRKLIPEDLVTASFADQGGGRGLAWDLGPVFPHGAGHTGFTGTALWLCPEKNLTAVLLASRLALPGPPELREFRRRVFSALYEIAGP